MARPTNYEIKLKSQDPNGINSVVHKTQCRTVNDFVDWKKLSGKVTTRHLTKDEVKLYIEGKLSL